MKKLKHYFRIGGMSALFIFMVPVLAYCQSAGEDTAFTKQALVMGCLVLSVIILVFLGLMLKARVDELRVSLRKGIQEMSRTSRWEKVMSLSEEEVDTLLQKRLQTPVVDRASPPAVKS